MMLYIIGGYILLPSIFNLITGIYARKKTLNNIIKNIEELGYKVDTRYKENLPKTIHEKVHTRDFSNSDYALTLSYGTWFPIVRLLCVYWNIKYLTGSYVGCYKSFGELEDLSFRTDIIEHLINQGLIKEDLEQQIWLEDREIALKELEDKYDDMKIDDKISLYSFSENDSTDELYKKMAILQEMIERKESEKQNKLTLQRR